MKKKDKKRKEKKKKRKITSSIKNNCQYENYQNIYSLKLGHAWTLARTYTYMIYNNYYRTRSQVSNDSFQNTRIDRSESREFSYVIGFVAFHPRRRAYIRMCVSVTISTYLRLTAAPFRTSSIRHDRWRTIASVQATYGRIERQIELLVGHLVVALIR